LQLFITIYHKYVGHILDIFLDMGNFGGYGVLTRRWLFKNINISDSSRKPVFLTKEHLDLKQHTSKHEHVGKRWIQPMLKLNAVAAVPRLRL